MNPNSSNLTPTPSISWLRKARWVYASLTFSILAACGGGGGAGVDPSSTNAAQFSGQIKSSVLQMSESEITEIQSVAVSAKDIVTLIGSQEMAKKYSKGQIVNLPPGTADFQFGYTGKVISKIVDINGGVELILEPATVPDVFDNLNIDYDMARDGVRIAGVISPPGAKSTFNFIDAHQLGVSELKDTGLGLSGTISTTYEWGSDGCPLETVEKTNSKKRLVFSGTIDNLLLKKKIKYFPPPPSNPNLTGPGSTVNLPPVSSSYEEVISGLSGKISVTAKFEGEISSGSLEDRHAESVKLANAVKECQNKLYGKKKFPFSITGLDESDKSGLLPIVGFLLTPAGPVKLSEDSDLLARKGTGLIIWFYINAKGEIVLKGDFSVKYEANFDYEVELSPSSSEPDAFIANSTRSAKAPNSLKTEFNGSAEANQGFGVTVATDLVVMGVRPLTLGVSPLIGRLDVAFSGNASYEWLQGQFGGSICVDKLGVYAATEVYSRGALGVRILNWEALKGGYEFKKTFEHDSYKGDYAGKCVSSGNPELNISYSGFNPFIDNNQLYKIDLSRAFENVELPRDTKYLGNTEFKVDWRVLVDDITLGDGYFKNQIFSMDGKYAVVTGGFTPNNGKFELPGPNIVVGLSPGRTYKISLKMLNTFPEKSVDKIITVASINANPTNPTVLQSVSFWITEAYQTVKSVVWSFADAIGTQTASVVEGISTAITHVFSTIGSTLVTATLQDAANKVLGTLTTTINVSALPMPTVYITGATSDTATQPGDIALNGTTNDTTPVLKGTLSAALKATQHVNIYDGSTQFVAYANVVGTSWTFTPATPLSSGVHSFTADVSDELANTGSRSESYVINISASPASPFTDVGQNNGFNNPTLENVYEIKKIGLDTSDGTLRLPLTVGEVDSTFPYIWIANSGEGTISKLATRDHYRKSPQTGEQELVKTGQELGRYRTGPGNGNPSRTTVDQDGNVWVGNRDNNTITKVGLFEFGNCIDRNGNGKIDTSAGKDDLKDWGGSFGDGQGFVNALDECVLQHVNLQAEGVDTPTDIRLIAIDKDNNVFAGGTNRQSIFKVNGSTGQIIKGAMTNGSFYGGLIDKNNNLWAASRITGYGMVHKVSNDLNNSEIISANLDVYGIALDKYGKIWVTNAYAPNFATFNPADIAGTLTVFSQQGRNSGGCYAQGVAVDDNDNIFIAGGHSQCASDSVVGHYKQVANGSTTSVQFVANYQVSSGPTGVAVDGKGNVWSTDYSNNAVSRITLVADPVNAKIDTFPVGATPYNYSDMTGRTVRNITNRQGTWEAVFDGGVLNFEWKKLVWSLKNQLPQGTAVAAYAKTANAKVDLGGKQYQQVENNLPLSGMKGQFIKVKFVLTSADSKSTPEITGIDFQ